MTNKVYIKRSGTKLNKGSLGAKIPQYMHKSPL